MELLDQLERRIGALLAKVESLTAENEALKAGQADAMAALTQENASLKEAQASELTALADENHKLLQQLEAEQALKNQALERIQAIIERIGANTDQE